jgi:hypothetical protein
MSQKSILENAKKYISSDDLTEFKNLFTSSIELPNANTVSEILKYAASLHRGKMVQEICQLKGFNKPHQDAVDYALNEAYSQENLQEFEHICTQSVVKPSRYKIEEVLKAAHQYPHYKWNFVEYICSLNTENKPQQPAIDDAFKVLSGIKNKDQDQSGLIKRLCSSVNKPSRAAIDYVLEKIFSNDDMDTFKYICEQSAVKPSRNAIEEVLKAAHQYPNYKWNFVEYICSLNTENKPQQPAIDDAFKVLSGDKNKDQDQSGLIKRLCSSINKPSRAAIDYVLEKIFSNDDMDTFKYICEQSAVKPSRNAIEEVLKAAHQYPNYKWNFVEYICSLNTENKPQQPAIDDALKELSGDKDQSGLIKGLCSSVNKPSRAAIDYVLEKIFSNDDMDTFKYICKQSAVKPSRNGIEKVLKAAHQWPHYKWNFVEYICSLNSENKPQQPAIDAALKVLSGDKDQSGLIKKLCSKDSVNKPSDAAIDHVLEKIFSNDDMDTFQYICEQSAVKPSRNQIEEILKAAHKWPNYKWNFVEYLCLLNSENKPGQNAFDDAFHTAAEVKQWKLVKTLYLSANKPTLLTIESVLKIAACYNQLEIIQDFCKFPVDLCPTAPAVGEAFIAAASKGYLDIIEFFLGADNPVKPTPEAVAETFVLKTEHKPDQKLIGEALGAAASNGHLDIIEFFLGPDNPVKPTPEAVAEAFVKGALENRVDVIRYFCMLETEHKPNQKLIGQALIAAASKGSSYVVLFFMATDNAIKPTSEDIAEAFVKASAAGMENVVEYFLSPDKELEFKFTQEIMDKALYAAVKTPSYELSLIQYLVKSNEASKLLSKQGLQNALNEAQKKPHNKDIVEIINLLTQEINKGSSHQSSKTASGKGEGKASSHKFYKTAEENNESPHPSAESKKSSHSSAESKKSSHSSAESKKSSLSSAESKKSSLPSAESKKSSHSSAESKKSSHSSAESKKSSHSSAESKKSSHSSAESKKSSLPTKGQSNKPAPEAIANTLYSAVAREELPEIKQLCTQLNYNKPTANVLRKALKMTLTPEIKECLLDAQKILKLHLQIEALVAYGEELKKENSSMGDGAVNIAQGIKTIADDYTSAYFGNQIEVKAACREQLSSALSTAFKKMGTHRAKWKIHLANVALAATGVGLLINYLVSGHVFFSNTGRQNKVQAIVDKLDNLTPKSSKP